MNDARARALRRAVATVGQQEAQERRTKRKRQENARQRKRDRHRTQRDTWAQVSHEPEQWTSALAVTQHQPPTGVVLERSVNEESMGTAEMFEQKEVPQTGGGHRDRGR